MSENLELAKGDGEISMSSIEERACGVIDPTRRLLGFGGLVGADLSLETSLPFCDAMFEELPGKRFLL
jgi:hypothetical protein